MTDLPLSGAAPVAATAVDRVGFHSSRFAVERLKKRYRSEAVFRGIGLGALLLAGLFLVFFLSTIVREGVPAFFQNYVTLNVDLKKEELDPNGTGDPKVIGQGNFDAVVRDALYAAFPGVRDRTERRALSGLVSSGSPVLIRREVVANPGWVGTQRQMQMPLDDVADLYLKGQVTTRQVTPGRGDLGASAVRGEVTIATSSNNFGPILSGAKAQLGERAEKLRGLMAGRQLILARLESQSARFAASVTASTGAARTEAERQLAAHTREIEAAKAEYQQYSSEVEALQKRIVAADQRETLDRELPSYLLRVNGGLIKLTSVTSANAVGQVLMPLANTDTAGDGKWDIIRLDQPEANRKIGDREIAFLDSLRERGMVNQSISREFFLGGASREAELAGVGVAIVGSLITLVITLGICFPIGVAAAIYLEEFAPKNWLTSAIEVNINNLAAIPSIIFGLLGLAVFLNAFDMPRSAPIVGGLVLALMTLPIIIIASRAAIRAVPPSIKEAAIGIGASHQQAVFHHVLPLAMPGILTGTILGMAHALGETAPLLMIGMVAFVVDYPKGLADAATLLPVQIFMWADFPEVAFQQKTAAAILVLLVFLICMNMLAIILRKRFERRW